MTDVTYTCLHVHKIEDVLITLHVTWLYDKH